MPRSWRRISIALCVLTVFQATFLEREGSAQDIVDGDARWSFFGDLNDFEAAPGEDRLFQKLWFWRIEGDPQETEFDFSTAAATFNGDVALHTFQFPSFSATIETDLTDQGAGGLATVVQTLHVINHTASPFTFHLFLYVDFDINGSDGDLAAFPSNLLEIRDSTTQNMVIVDALVIDHFEVGSFPTLRNSLRDASPTQLGDFGTPFGPGNFTGAFQWTRTLQPGVTQLFAAIYHLDGDTPGPVTGFRRADANVDGSVNLADAVSILNHLFAPGTPQPSCADALDTNDDGVLNIADAVSLLGNLFTAPGSPIPPPGTANCGDDPTPDPLDCLVYPTC